MAEPVPRTTAEEPWSVRVVSQKIGAWIAKLGWVWVDGQVAQVSRRPGSTGNVSGGGPKGGRGMVFLTLRDPSADISVQVTTFADVYDGCDPPLREGARVVAHARPEFYAARGTLSLRADELRHVGLGELLARLERLKKLLAAEGLFDPARKRRLPFLPGRVGLVTGRASAAERDVVTNARDRWPGVAFRIVNTPVQGPSAVPAMVDALTTLDRDPEVDVIVLARGGGGIEDLLPFSDEALCRAVFGCRTPVVSAIGHETDTPLVDFVADVRASTPTDAGKRIVPDLVEEGRLVALARRRLDRAVENLLERERHRLDALRTRPALAQPEAVLDRHAEHITALRDRSDRCLRHRLDAASAELTHTRARLRAISPQATLNRGYAVVQRPDGTVLRRPTDVAPGDPLRIRLAEGDLAATAGAIGTIGTTAGAGQTTGIVAKSQSSGAEDSSSTTNPRRNDE